MIEYKWHDIYKAALLETDWSKMEERIKAAEGALHARKHEFSVDHGGTPEENQAIADALRALNVLRKEVNARMPHDEVELLRSVLARAYEKPSPLPLRLVEAAQDYIGTRTPKKPIIQSLNIGEKKDVA